MNYIPKLSLNPPRDAGACRLISVWLLPDAEHVPMVCVPPAAAAPRSAQAAVVESDSDGMQVVCLSMADSAPACIRHAGLSTDAS